MTRRTIVFERLTLPHLPLACWYALRGYHIHYLRASWNIPGLRAIRLKEPLYVRFNPAGDMASERTEALYELFARQPLVQRMIGLFLDERIHLAFKKYLHALLEQHCYYALLGERLREALELNGTSRGTFWFVPARGAGGALPAVTGANLPPWGLPFLRGSAVVEQVPPLAFRVPWWSRVRSRARELWDNGRVCAETVLLAVWQCCGGRRHPAARRPYAFAVALIAPMREFANDIRGCDLLLDGERIRKDNTLFVPVARLSPAQRETLHAKGLHLAAHPCRPSGRTVGRVVRETGAVAARLLEAPWWIVRVAAYLVRDYGIWSSFLAAYQPDQFISYNDFSFRHIPRNILLHRAGVRTWYYADAVNTFSTFLARDGELSFRQTIWSYLLYDMYVSWSGAFSRYIGAHRHAIGAFMNVGCLWSEHVRLLQEGTLSSSLRERLVRAGWSPAQRLVAVFDSTYGRDFITDDADGLAFAQGIRQLLDDAPDLFVVWKAKKAPAPSARLDRHARDLAASYAQLAKHPRCVFAAHTTSPSELLALCDLSISFPFTSTAIEALGARVKALYYDPQAKYRASYYARIPGLVAHGYDALRRRVDELLAIERAAYDAYLDDAIKGTVDPHLDGRGLTRFRDALCGISVDAPRETVEPQQVTVVSAPC